MKLLKECVSFPITPGAHRVGYVHRSFRQQLTPKLRPVSEGFKCQRDLQISIHNPSAKYLDGLVMVQRIIGRWQWFHVRFLRDV
jgi:hypothetical protein